MIRFLWAAAFSVICSSAIAASAISSGGSYPAGDYSLANNISASSGSVLTLAANTALDLNGKTITCTSPAPSTATTFGISVGGNNVTIRNGKITGCFFGINAGYLSNITIDGVDFTGNTYIGINGGTKITNSIFSGITGYSNEAYSVAINGPSAGCLIQNNVFKNLHRQPLASSSKVGEGVGVLMNAGSTNCIVRWNWFENDVLGPEADIAIWAGGSGPTITENTVTNFGRGIASGLPVAANDNRFWMRDPEAGSLAVGAAFGSAVNDNFIQGYCNAVGGGAVAGSGNVIVPWACP